ncbi:MAG: GNAT family N-acetyltransferase [Myxococcota bacterium]|nr:GNAT family N-acetyltransferase [Myxococcota bacterium]
MRIRVAEPSEAQAISALAVRSKAHWDYTPEQMAVFSEELRVLPEQVAERHAHVAEDGGLLGFYTLLPLEDGRVELEHLFVEPAALGCGLGRALFEHACACAARLGFRELFIQSDPNAAGFYTALGARALREIPSSIPGRSIPTYAFPLEPLP